MAKDQVELIGVTVTFIPMQPGTPYSLIEWEAAVGSPSPPVHIHHKTDEGFYVLAGEFGFLVDGLKTAAPADAEQIFARLLPRAFRRPAAPDEIARYTDLLKRVLDEGQSFESALRVALRAVL